ncbi:4'-phosphopantetheinyl transferase superfamily protein [Streptomyces xanthochromogenes]|uniref:holo-ACP synthase n=1 Tax=Streptomyces xanthochromogenes TaxID=67384 RepID=UPI00342FA4B6
MGVGLDVLDHSELDRLFERCWFMRYCYASEEIERSQRLTGARRREYLCGRFAAKEAVLKALGRGLFQGIAPHDIVVGRAPEGAPLVELRAAAAEAAPSVTVTVSITHKGDVVAAVALATRRTPEDGTEKPKADGHPENLDGGRIP